MRRTPLTGLLLLILATSAAFPRDSPGDSNGEAIRLSSDLRVVVRAGRDVELQVLASDGGYEAIAARTCGEASDATAIEAYNGPLPESGETWVRIPLAMLSPDFRSLVLRSLFPRDRHDGEDWIHVARSGLLPTYDEGLWQVAQWFGGSGANFEQLMKANQLSSPELRNRQEIRVPVELLHPAFRPRLRSDDGSLEYASDRDGPYAAYRLKQGEALYSATVVRFTGRTGSEDVTAIAQQIVERSAITDLRDIPVNFEVKIPFDLLEPDYLPANHPRRLAAEAKSAELAEELAREPLKGIGRGLEGVLVVIDPGHGGRDLGTMNNGIWEHDYVYDVACRLKHKLERETSAKVIMTLMDMETGCKPATSDKLKANHQGTILTSPVFLAKKEGEAKIGVNLRWYLANSVYRKAQKDGVDKDRVVFLSLHADSRHSSLRGLMVYVPGSAYRSKTYGPKSSTYRKYKEVREKPQIRFSRKERLRSEAVSRKLADNIVNAFRREELPIQPYQPIRNKVIRGKSKWVPAVLRGNAIPNKVLVEMVNLSNPQDAKLLGQARARDQMASGLARSLYGYFGEKPPDLAALTRSP